MRLIDRLSRRLATTGLIAVTWFAALPLAAAELVMVDRAGCPYCIAWKEQIGPAYPNTDLGAYAPLRIVDIRDGAPAGMTFARPALFTPTFILIEDGQELGRIEGYPGEDFFWGLLEKLLKEKTDFIGAS
ncbi:MAG: thioredoxin family protein [Paracoccaceae bacterium]|uniref:thioredoxin family protein n=1 Tax=Seohaeicola saemankumensis TaxID=481181 RepID=UPI001E53036C|nr:thioredoxin family protein [Seohaeicola saemankumensis]